MADYADVDQLAFVFNRIDYTVLTHADSPKFAVP